MHSGCHRSRSEAGHRGSWRLSVQRIIPPRIAASRQVPAAVWIPGVTAVPLTPVIAAVSAVGSGGRSGRHRHRLSGPRPR